ncbi:MAG: hypothetical protein ACREMX_07110 [Gemmatimonadales bacterium]
MTADDERQRRSDDAEVATPVTHAALLAEWLDFYTPAELIERFRMCGFVLARDESGGLSLVDVTGTAWPLNEDTLPGPAEHIRAKLAALHPKRQPTVEQVRAILSATSDAAEAFDPADYVIIPLGPGPDAADALAAALGLGEPPVVPTSCQRCGRPYDELVLAEDSVPALWLCPQCDATR